MWVVVRETVMFVVLTSLLNAFGYATNSLASALIVMLAWRSDPEGAARDSLASEPLYYLLSRYRKVFDVIVLILFITYIVWRVGALGNAISSARTGSRRLGQMLQRTWRRVARR